MDPTTSQDAMLACFRRWDTDGNGTISQQELASALVGIGLRDSDLPKLFSQADLDKDGRVDYEEFVAWLYAEAPDAVKNAPKEVDDEAAWPLMKFRQGFIKYCSAPKGPAVIFTTGGMNPIHLGHVQLLHQAKARLEKAGYGVAGMWLSPSHDGYLLPKAESLGTIGLSAAFRLAVARKAVMDDELVAIGAWEAQQAGGWPDFPEVADALEVTLDQLWKNGELDQRPKVFYACGTDHAAKCDLYYGMPGGQGVVVVPRSGEEAETENPESDVFVAEPSVGELAALSSTKLRSAIADRNYDSVVQCMSRQAAEFLLHPSAEMYSQFESDLSQLGVK